MIRKALPLLLAFIVALTSFTITYGVKPTYASEHRYTNKTILTYVGKYVDSNNTKKDYPAYTASQISNLYNSGITEFILKGDLATDLTKYQRPYSPDEENTLYVTALIENMKLIKSATQGKAKVWYATPGRTYSYTSSTDWDATTFNNWLSKVKTAVINDPDLGQTFWDYNVNGVYVNIENVYFDNNTYTGDYWSKLKTNMDNNKSVKLFTSLSNYTKGTLKKQIIWAPYYVSNDEHQLKRLAYVINKGIFDFALLQPSYYFYSTSKAGLTGVYNSVKNGTVSWAGITSPILPSAYINKTTTIGIDMEIDDQIKQPTYLSRYKEYEGQYREFLNKYPFTYYSGSASHLSVKSSENLTVMDYISGFYMGIR
ncbi:hypothetical protein [Bacillus toyonensis]|uniref:Uncharacterized protein n=1 Tax=Bacillus toyonensis TaxID=155322 RepID=A0AB73SH09_9BACI|nr:hypothetical protein [Bacillus toyonensis]PEI83389.1 hypothetical protein CN678_23995 [Bacillus toyonensis]PEM41102.1 hypothetical protein CN636_22970 [Bacillus toyonensis]